MTQHLSTMKSVSLARENFCLHKHRDAERRHAIAGFPGLQPGHHHRGNHALTFCMSCCTRAGLSLPYSTAMSRSFGMSRSQALYSMLA